MKQNPDILLELQDIAPTLASLQGRGNPFTLPQNEWKPFETTVEAMGPYETEKLVFGSKANVWAVPEDYFQTFSKTILAQTTTAPAAITELAEIPKLGAFTAPTHYFEGLADLVLEKAQQANLGGKANNAFTTPTAYFENFETQLFEKIEQSTKQMPRVRKMIIWRSSAIAAILSGVIFSAVWLLRSSSVSIGVTAVAPTAMNEQQVQEYVQEQASEAEIQSMVEANEQSSLQEEELQKLLTNPSETKTENKKAEVEEYISNEIDESTLTELL